MFYTIAIGAAAVAPPLAGFIGDFIGIPATVMIVSALTLATIPFALLLKDPRLGEQRIRISGRAGRARCGSEESWVMMRLVCPLPELTSATACQPSFSRGPGRNFSAPRGIEALRRNG
jgi:hypothetical protein